MNDATIFWPAFWSGFGVGLIVATTIAFLVCVLVVAIMNRVMEEDDEAERQRRLTLAYLRWGVTESINLDRRDDAPTS